MSATERLDVWLHERGLRKLARFLGVCALMDHRLDGAEFERRR